MHKSLSYPEYNSDTFEYSIFLFREKWELLYSSEYLYMRRTNYDMFIDF